METCSHDSDSKLSISTFVFLDFEATGLLGGSKRPKITELCLLAVTRKDLMDGGFPRITNKLQLCFNPQKPIEYMASSISGLYNDTLEDQSIFSADTVALISHFLKHLQQPVCFIAHNGNGYDYPLLCAELNTINQSLADNILCADSLVAFRSLDRIEQTETSTVSKINNGCVAPVMNNNQAYRTPEHSSTTASHPPLLKRKSTNDTKDLPHSSNPDAVEEAEKVKKRLKFEEQLNIVSKSEQISDQVLVHRSINNGFPNIEETVHDGRIEADSSKEKDRSSSTLNESSTGDLKKVCASSCEFSSSLADEDLLEAVTEFEKQKSFEQREEENSLKKRTSVTQADSAAVSGAPGCYVTSGTGYHICPTVDQLASAARQLFPGDSSSDSALHKVSVSAAKGLTKCIKSENDQQSNTAVSTISPREAVGKTVTVTSREFIPLPSTSACNHSNSNHNQSPAAKPSVVTPVKRVSYKLEEIYRRLYGKFPAMSHQAEDDCVTLLKVAQRSQDFISWVDRNAVLFSSIQPAY